MTTRTVTGDLPQWPSTAVIFRNIDPIISGGDTYPPKDTTVTTDSGGDFSTVLIVPDSGAARYVVTLPAEAGRPVPRVQFLLEAGASIDLATIIPIALTEYDPDYLSQVLSGYEPALGNPAADGYVLSSTDEGVRSWVAQSGGGGGAPTDATYITQTPNGSLSAEQALSALATGLLKNTTTTGVLSIATAGTDYAAPATTLAGYGITDAQPLDSDLTAIAALSTTNYGRSLLALADAAAGRTAFSLGTAAVVDTGTGSGNVPTIAQADARYQPLDSDLTAIAALTTTAYGRAFLALADAAAGRTALGLGTAATSNTGDFAAASHTHAQGDVTNLTSDLALKAPLASPTFTGTPAAPTAAGGTNTTQVATTAFVTSAVATHETDTTSVHGIADTSALLTTASAAGGDLSGTLGNLQIEAGAVGTTEIAGDAVTYAKIQNVSATDKVLGRSSSGAGDVEEITFTAAARSLVDDTTTAAMLTTLGAQTAVSLGRLNAAGAVHLTLPGVSTNTQGTAAIAANTVRYFPIYVSTPITVDQLVIAVTGAGAGSTTARLGICNADADWVPGSLVLDAGTVAVDSTGNKTISVNQALAAGRYFLMLNSDGTPTLRIMRGNIPQGPLLSTLGGSPLVVGLSGAQTYGTFPGTSTAIGTVTSGTLAFEYLVFMRLSAA